MSKSYSKDGGERMPTPNAIVTRRAVPRVVALCALALFAVSWKRFYPELQDSVLPALVLFNGDLHQGTNHIIVKDQRNPDAPCSGAFAISIANDSIEISGALHGILRDIPERIDLEGRAEFTSYRYASFARLQLKSAEGWRMKFFGSGNNAQWMHAWRSESAGSESQTTTFRRPQPLLLVPTTQHNYQLIVAPSARYRFSEVLPLSAESEKTLENFSIVRANSVDYLSCEESLRSSGGRGKPDLRPLLRDVERALFQRTKESQA